MDAQSIPTQQPQTADTVTTAVKRSLASIKGSVVPQQIKINHPALRKTFKHAYDISDAHLYYCSVFCRATLPLELVKPETDALHAVIANTASELDALTKQMQAIADTNGIGPGVNFSDQIVDTQASTPLSKRYLDVYRKADQYLAIIDALWIEGVIDDDRHAKAAPAMSQTCHRLSRQIDAAFRRLLAENNAKKSARSNLADTAAANSTDERKVA